MTEIIDKRLASHHLRVMSTDAARTDCPMRLAVAKCVQAYTKCGGSRRVRSQKGSKGPPLMPEMPETPSEANPLAETVKIRTEMVVAAVAVLATRKCAGSRTKTLVRQAVGPVDRRHELASMLGAAGVVYLKPFADLVRGNRANRANLKGLDEMRIGWTSRFAGANRGNPPCSAPVAETTGCEPRVGRGGVMAPQKYLQLGKKAVPAIFLIERKTSPASRTGKVAEIEPVGPVAPASTRCRNDSGDFRILDAVPVGGQPRSSSA